MGRKKFILFILLTMILAYGSVTTTYSYFSIREKVSNDINVELGNVNANFVDSNGAILAKEIVNITGILPGEEKEIPVIIKNTSTLTSKVALSFSDFSGDISLQPYLSCKIIMGDNSLEGKFSELPGKSLGIKENNKPKLLKQNDQVSGKIIVKLNQDTPYTEQNKTIRFNINIYASQPNDADWHIR